MNVPSVQPPREERGQDEPVEQPSRETAQTGRIIAIESPSATVSLEEYLGHLEALQRLREPFPAERIEKLPKPLFKGAWDRGEKGQCGVCNGYHVLANTIHLDYVGHANCTDRLLSVDPEWNWEPMALTPEGMPLFSNGGLWIRLTIAGITRIGFGDGGSVKEIIGDAIRNAAMRFGVALDLWAKVDLHEGINPGVSTRERRPGGSQDQRSSTSGDGGQSRQATPETPPRSPNQDALDDLGAVCDDEGIDRSSIRGWYLKWITGQPDRPDTDILDADAVDITAFTQHLIEVAVQGEDAANDQGAASGTPAGDGDAAAQSEPATDPGGLDQPAGAGAGAGGAGEAGTPGDGPGDDELPAEGDAGVRANEGGDLF